MVFIRHKKIKGHTYAYLVRNIWDNQNKKVRQETVKYLGKSSKITLQNVPEQYQNDPNIVASISTFNPDNKKIEQRESVLQDELIKFLMDNRIDELIKICEKYSRIFELSRIFGLAKFYDRLLTPVMYMIGQMWEHGTMSIVTEHICSNAAQSLVKIINDRFSGKSKTHNTKKILLCTPEGELHCLGCMMIESILIRKGYSVINSAPSVPSESVISFIDENEPDMILISVTLKDNFNTTIRLIKNIRSFSFVPILVGGNGIDTKEIINHRLQNVKFLKDGTFSNIINMDLAESFGPIGRNVLGFD